MKSLTWSLTILLNFYLVLPSDGSVLNGEEKETFDFKVGKTPESFHELPKETAAQVVRTLASHNASLSVTFNQAPGTTGTLFAVYSRPHRRLLEVELYGLEGAMRISIATKTGGVSTIEARRMMADDVWHQLILEFDQDRLRVIVDCYTILNDRFPVIDLAQFAGSLSLPSVWLGRRDRFNSILPGNVKEFSVEPGSLGATVCKQGVMPLAMSLEDEEAESSRQGGHEIRNSRKVEPAQELKEKIHRTVDYLSHKVGYLENQFKKWRDVVEGQGSDLKTLQLHSRDCQVDAKKVLKDGERMENKTECSQCVCHQGALHCSPLGCPRLNCTYPLPRAEGECCPKCGRSCYHMTTKKYHEHGEVYFPKECVKCTCHNGDQDCVYELAHNCKTPDCPQKNQVTPPDKCCPVCKGIDFCAKMKCGENATCVNGKFAGKCECKEGYYGTGTHCYDVDECLWRQDVADQIGCGPGTRCINMPGSFRCECLPGYARLSERACLDTVVF